MGEGGIAGRRWTGGDGRGAGIWASTGRGKGGDADGDFGCVGLLDGAIRIDEETETRRWRRRRWRRRRWRRSIAMRCDCQAEKG